jgi:hypothetical protein
MGRVRLIIYLIRQWPMPQNAIEFQAPLDFGQRAKKMKIMADGKILLIFGPSDNAHWTGGDNLDQWDELHVPPLWAQEIVGNSNTTFMVVCPRRFQVLRTHRCVFTKYVPCFALTGNRKSVIIAGSGGIRILRLDTGKFSFSVVRPCQVRYRSPINFTLPVLDDNLLFTATIEENHFQGMEDYMDLISLWDEELISTLE